MLARTISLLATALFLAPMAVSGEGGVFYHFGVSYSRFGSVPSDFVPGLSLSRIGWKKVTAISEVGTGLALSLRGGLLRDLHLVVREHPEAGYARVVDARAQVLYIDSYQELRVQAFRVGPGRVALASGLLLSWPVYQRITIQEKTRVPWYYGNRYPWEKYELLGPTSGYRFSPLPLLGFHWSIAWIRGALAFKLGYRILLKNSAQLANIVGLSTDLRSLEVDVEYTPRKSPIVVAPASDAASRLVLVGGNFHFASASPGTWRPGANVRVLHEHWRGQNWSWIIGVGLGTRTLVLRDKWIGGTTFDGPYIAGPYDIRISLSCAELDLGSRKYLRLGERGRFYYSAGILPTFCLTNMTEITEKRPLKGIAPPSRPDYGWTEDPGELGEFFARYLCAPLAVYVGWGYEFGGNMVEARLTVSRLLDCWIAGVTTLGQAYAGLSLAFGARE